VLEFNSAMKRFGPVAALDGCTFAARPGRITGFLGPNGAGKTTAMRIILGVLAADSGQVRWQGRPLILADRRRIGYMPEERGLYPDMRVRDQLVYFARLAGVGKADARARTDVLLERLGIADRAGEPVERLSLGNQQRVQLAAALVHEPDALVLDEPFSGLDPIAAASLSEIVQEAARAGRTVLFSSHQLDLVEDLSESVAVIDRGRLVMVGRVSDLKARSGRRELRIAMEGEEARRRLEAAEGVRVTAADATGLRLALPPGADPLELLDRARAEGEVRDFGLEQPTLAELFLDAVDGDGRR
jgi:ABC-2 type transport system ATP-binding protein